MQISRVHFILSQAGKDNRLQIALSAGILHLPKHSIKATLWKAPD